MAIDTNVQTFTDSELLNLYRLALAKIASGQSYSIGTRSLTNADLGEVRDMIQWLETRVNTDDTGGGAALVQFGDPS